MNGNGLVVGASVKVKRLTSQERLLAIFERHDPETAQLAKDIRRMQAKNKKKGGKETRRVKYQVRQRKGRMTPLSTNTGQTIPKSAGKSRKGVETPRKNKGENDDLRRS